MESLLLVEITKWCPEFVLLCSCAVEFFSFRNPFSSLVFLHLSDLSSSVPWVWNGTITKSQELLTKCLQHEKSPQRACGSVWVRMRGIRGGAGWWWAWFLYRYMSSVGGVGGYRKWVGRNIRPASAKNSKPTADWRFHFVLKKEETEEKWPLYFYLHCKKNTAVFTGKKWQLWLFRKLCKIYSKIVDTFTE